MSSSSMPALRALAALALLPVLAACQDQAISAVAKPERPVQVQRVALQSENTSREFVGVVRARYETDLGFRVAGKITERIVNVGDRVHTGDVIARLDPQDLGLQVASAEAEIAAATSSFAQASSDEVRFASLKARGYAAVADYERKKSAKDEADGRLEPARRALELARNQLAYAELTANADGVITATLARSPGRSSPWARRWRGWRSTARWKRWSRCPRPGSARRGRCRRACACGRDRSAVSRRICASCRRRRTR
jgi:multidrug efflux pump subunit AcrA (membrane-fusion protein)